MRRWLPLAFVAWTVLVVAGGTQSIDDAAVESLAKGGAGWQAWTHVGDTVVVAALTAVVVAVLLLQRQPHTARRILVTMLLTWGLIFALKLLIDRDRPPGSYEVGLSYPSGHATGSLVFFALAALLLRAPRGVQWLALAVGLSQGLSRLALGVHYVSDVVGGWLLAASVLVWAIPTDETR